MQHSITPGTPAEAREFSRILVHETNTAEREGIRSLLKHFGVKTVMSLSDKDAEEFLTSLIAISSAKSLCVLADTIADVVNSVKDAVDGKELVAKALDIVRSLDTGSDTDTLIDILYALQNTYR